jgi:hypothetical protein
MHSWHYAWPAWLQLFEQVVLPAEPLAAVGWVLWVLLLQEVAGCLGAASYAVRWRVLWQPKAAMEAMHASPFSTLVVL